LKNLTGEEEGKLTATGALPLGYGNPKWENGCKEHSSVFS